MKQTHLGSFARLWALCLALCLLAAPALADDTTRDTWYFGGDRQDYLYTALPLPTGNLLLSGYTRSARGGQPECEGLASHAWLLCLKPDGSIAWEVVDAKPGATRYIQPRVQEGERISVLYFNSPRQVNTEIAIHTFSLEGELLKETVLPFTDALADGMAMDGYLFSNYENNEESIYYADEGSVRRIGKSEEHSVRGNGLAGVLPTKDGWTAVGRAVSDSQTIAAIAHMDAQGNEVWRYSREEPESGGFGLPVQLDDGSILVAWYALDKATHSYTDQRLLCLSPQGELLWERALPDDLGKAFTVTDEGYVFGYFYLEKTYAHYVFTLIDHEGNEVWRRQAEKRRETPFGGDMFTWQGEAWMLIEPKRNDRRISERQDDLDLEDAGLIRVRDCAPVQPSGQ